MISSCITTLSRSKYSSGIAYISYILALNCQKQQQNIFLTVAANEAIRQRNSRLLWSLSHLESIRPVVAFLWITSVCYKYSQLTFDNIYNQNTCQSVWLTFSNTLTFTRTGSWNIRSSAMQAFLVCLPLEIAQIGFYVGCD